MKRERKKKSQDLLMGGQTVKVNLRWQTNMIIRRTRLGQKGALRRKESNRKRHWKYPFMNKMCMKLRRRKAAKDKRRRPWNLHKIRMEIAPVSCRLFHESQRVFALKKSCHKKSYRQARYLLRSFLTIALWIQSNCILLLIAPARAAYKLKVVL
jgi:hypothetical protein